MAYNSAKGTCYLIEDKNICYIPISKNGSSSVRESMKQQKLSFTVKNFLNNPEILKNNHVVVILREPIKRFCSGYIEVINRASGDSPETMYKPFYWIDNDEHRRFDCFIDEVSREFFDTHIEPQIYYITDENGNMVKIDQFIVLENLSDEIEKLLKIKINKINSSANHGTIVHGTTYYIQDYLNIIYTNQRHYKRLHNLYKDDINLYNKILKNMDDNNDSN
tara:strand:+ start:29504 stop:30166 length:663 start_codon:yes stop_codon:yes gene_type:complete